MKKMMMFKVMLDDKNFKRRLKEDEKYVCFEFEGEIIEVPIEFVAILSRPDVVDLGVA